MCLFCNTHLYFRYQLWVVQAHKFNHVPSLPFSISHTIQARNSHSTSSREMYLWRWSECVWQIVCVRVKSCNMCRVCTSRAIQKLTYTSSLFLVSNLLLLLMLISFQQKIAEWLLWQNCSKDISKSTLFTKYIFQKLIFFNNIFNHYVIISACIILILNK